MDLGVLQALSSGDNISFKEDNTTTFTSMKKKKVWVIAEQMREKHGMSLITSLLEKPLIRKRFSSLCRAQCLHISHLLVPKQARYTASSVQHHYHFIHPKISVLPWVSLLHLAETVAPVQFHPHLRRPLAFQNQEWEICKDGSLMYSTGPFETNLEFYF